MNRGELLTRITVWMALCGYAAGAALMMRSRKSPRAFFQARWAWTFGCVCFLAHVACAFHFFHGWSHDAALRETARQTAELTGLRWGGGIFLNYLFALVWLGDVLWWWFAPARFARRPSWLTILWQGFFLFMVINGAIVFGKGPVRWLGAGICAGLGVLWWKTRQRADSKS